MFNNNESQFDPSFKHSSRYSQTAARYGKTDSSGPRGDVEEGKKMGHATLDELDANAPPAINTGREKLLVVATTTTTINNTGNNIKIIIGTITDELEGAVQTG